MLTYSAKALRQDAQKFAEVMRDVETALISASDLGKHQDCLKTIGSVLDDAAEHLKRLQTGQPAMLMCCWILWPKTAIQYRLQYILNLSCFCSRGIFEILPTRLTY